jgi:hypothetical protein
MDRRFAVMKAISIPEKKPTRRVAMMAENKAIQSIG